MLSPTIAAAYYFSAPLARQEIRARPNDSETFSSYELPQTNGLVAGLGLTLETSREKCLKDQPRVQVIVQSEFLHFESAQTFDGTGRWGISLRYRF